MFGTPRLFFTFRNWLGSWVVSYFSNPRFGMMIPNWFSCLSGFFPLIGEDFAKNSDVRFSASMLEAPETFTVEEFSFEGWMVLNLSRSV